MIRISVYRVSAIGGILALLAGMMTASASMAHAQIQLPEPIDPDAKAQFTWSVPERYEQSWSAWNQPAATYDPDYANPTRWSVNIDGCRSTAKFKIERYTFKLTGIGFDWNRTFDGVACRLQLKRVLPRLGLYRFELSVHTRSGAGLPFKRVVPIQDWLIVSLGDSMASAEGNPDKPGGYKFNTADPWNGLVSTIRTAQWKDVRCHRSATSGHAQLARQVEESDPQSSVTFLSLACSGAEVANLIDEPYGGIVSKPGPAQLPPQIAVLESLVGRSAPRGSRNVDALLVSVGINDLRFSDIVKACALNNNVTSGSGRCVLDSGIEANLAELPAKYARLNQRLRSGQLGLGEVYITDYPRNVFKGGGCGLLGLPAVGINEVEGDLISGYGGMLNSKIEFAARDHGWNYANGVTQGFEGHSYCDGKTFFVHIEKSLGQQGDVSGTAHPNADGQKQIAAVLKKAVVLPNAIRHFRDAKLVIDEIKLGAVPSSGAASFDLVMFEFDDDDVGQLIRHSVSKSGEWVKLPQEKFTFDMEMFLPPAPPRVPTRISFIVKGAGSTLPATHTREDNYGAGAHEITTPQGNLSVRYHVEVTSPAAPSLDSTRR